MKKSILLNILLLLLFEINYSFSQSIQSCIKANSSSATTNPPNSPPSSSGSSTVCMPSDGEVLKYSPLANTPTVNFRVNYVFLCHPTYTAPWTWTSVSQLSVDAASGLQLMNNLVMPSGTYTPSLPVAAPSHTYADVKFRFVLNKVYKITDTLGYGNYAHSDYLFNKFALDTATAVNLYFYVDSYPGNCGFGWARLGYGAALAHCPITATHVPGTPIGDGLDCHELLHVIGYLGDNYVGRPTNNQDPMNYHTGNYFGGAGIGYIPDDAAIDIMVNYNCGLPYSNTNPVNNNWMANSNCRAHLSEKQTASIHYLVAKNITRKFTQYSNIPYPFTPPTTNTITLSGVQTLTAFPNFASELRISAGSKITFKNAHLRAAPNSRIIVEPGAKLRFECVNVDCYEPFGMWRGIEVWGNGYLPQSINSSGLYSGQGFFEAFDSRISKAGIGVLAGKRPNNTYWSLDYTSGGGVITATNTVFEDCQMGVNFLPKPSGAQGAPRENMSSFYFCDFKRNNNFNSLWAFTSSPEALVNLEGVREVLFMSNTFNGGNLNYYSSVDTLACIRGINSSVWVKNNSQISQFPIGNSFRNAYYGVYLTNSFGSIIEGGDFQTRNGAYLNNSVFCKITNNNFGISNNTTVITPGPFSGNLRTGLYLNQCSHYKVEGNFFYTFSNMSNQPSLLAEGICVNNSGPIATQIYNNRFKYLNQGIWCQGQNYDNNTAFGNGLKLNCNQFTDCDYDIGVQSPFSPPINNAGIATTQGLITNTFVTYTRNRYVHNFTTCSNENKFYSFTPWSVPPQVQHAAFNNSKYWVLPQPGCSDLTDIHDTIGTAPPFGDLFPSFCPDSSNFPANKVSLHQQISTLSGQIAEMSSNYFNKLDGGNTNLLLGVINGNTLSDAALKDTLINKVYLSDTAIIAYIKKTGPPDAYKQQVFAKNAPVTNAVWQRIVALNFNPAFMTSLSNYQQQNRTSARLKAEAPIALAGNERSYAITNLGLWMLNDSASTNVKDSLTALTILNNQGDVAKQLIDLDLLFGDHNSATTRLADYANAATGSKLQYVQFKNLYIQLMQSSNQLHEITTNTGLMAQIEQVANDESHPCSREARDILFNSYRNKYSVELKLSPVTNTGARSSQQNLGQTQSGELKQKELLLNGFKLYPNPSNSEVYIETGGVSNLAVKIYNIAGQLVFNQNLDSNQITKIAAGTLQEGIYLVNLYQDNLLVKSTKLLIAK